mgnify:CR=1 FL=1
MSGNALQPIFDAFWNAGELVYRLIKGKENFNIDKFFKDVELKNKQGIYPETYKEFDTELGRKYILNLPTGLELNDFFKIKNALEQQINRKTDMRYKDGFIEIQFINKKLDNIIPYNPPKRNPKIKSLEIPVGESIKDTVYIRTNDIPHVLISGTTGSGKSVAVRSILTSLITMYNPQELDLFLIDLKQVELNVFSRVKHCKCFIRNPYEASKKIEELMEECDKRYSKFFECGVNNIFDYNKKNPENKMKIQAIFIEEFVMMQLVGKQAMNTLKIFASLSRASGQYLFLSCQRPDNTVIDNVLKACLGNRLIFRTEDSKNSVICLDKEGAEKLKGEGHAILKQGAKTTELQAYWLSLDDAKEYIKPYLKTKEDIIKDEVNKNVDNTETKEESANNITDLSFLDKLDEL